MQNTSRLVHTTGNGGLKQVNSGIDSGLKVQFVPVGKTETAAKKVFLKIMKNSLENTCARISFLIKLQVFTEHLWTTASGKNLLTVNNTDTITTSIKVVLVFS